MRIKIDDHTVVECVSVSRGGDILFAKDYNKLHYNIHCKNKNHAKELLGLVLKIGYLDVSKLKIT